MNILLIKPNERETEKNTKYYFQECLKQWILKQETMDTKTIEKVGLTILKEKPEEITKDDFFKMLLKSKNGLNLKVARIGNTYKFKYKNKDGNAKLGFFIDYEFEYDNKNYMVGINYNVGAETDTAFNGVFIIKPVELLD